MNIKRISAAAMAAAVLAVGAPVMGLSDPLGVVASAAEEKLVTAALESETVKKLSEGDYVYLGSGYYALEAKKTITNEWGQNEVTVIYKLVRFGDKEIANWRSTGKFEPAEIKCDTDLSNCSYVAGVFLNGQRHIVLTDNGKGTSFFKLDEVAGKLTKVCDIPDYDDMFGRVTISGKEGYCVVGEVGAMAGQYITALYTPTGEKIDLTGKSFRADGIVSGMGKYAAYATSMSDFSKLYGICTDGSFEEVYTSTTGGVMGLFAGEGFVKMRIGNNTIILTSDGKEYKLGDVGEVSSVYGTSAVIYSTVLDQTTWDYIPQDYKLINIADNGKELSKAYKYMATHDNGKTYLVQSEDGKWGYIDGTGKELAMFDDAGAFTDNGLYAPVVKDGKGWLVDKDMNQVSEKIDAAGCVTMNAQLFRFTLADGSKVCVTSTSNGAGKSEASGSGTAVSDKATGVSVTGVPGAAEVKVSSKKNDNGGYTYDISPVDAGGNKVQPADAAVVGIMLPADLSGKTLNVYRVENGKYTKLNSWTDGDMFFFTTTHFSEFEITTEQREEANPGTGSTGIAGFAAVALAGVGMLIVSRKKR